MNDPKQSELSPPQPGLSRRTFLKSAGLLLGSLTLAACAAEPEEGWQAGEYYRTPTPAALLETPAAVDPNAPEGLEAFLALSSVLTGFEQLNPQLGAVYLRSLQENPEFAGGLQGLFEQAGSAPESVEALEEAGIFSGEATRSLADKIISLWYTGIYDQGDEQVVATFVDSLAWKSLTFTKPPTICGSFGFWSERPKGNY